MDNLAADFEINPNNPLNAEYELSEGIGFDCSFELFASGTVWGSIDGNINNQTDLINLLNTKVDLTSFEELSQTVTNNYNELSGDIADLTTTVTDNYNTLGGQISDLTGVVNDNYTSLDNRLTTAEGSILNLTDTVNDNYTELNGKITTTNNNLSTLSQTVQDNNTAINNRVDGIVNSFDGDISDLNNAIDNLSNTVSDNYTELNGKITVNTDNITTIQNTINSYGDIVSYDAAYFATANQGALADTALQPNDNISELVNNVGYITSASLPTVNNATITIQKNGADVGTFTLNQANNDTLNITVPTQASDIGAMPDTTTIEDLTTTAQLNALNSGATTSNIGQISTNQNNIANIRSLIPLQASTSNQLADKGFVNSSIATNTANFIGTFNSVAELEAYSGTLTNNDYAFVATTDSAGNTLYDRYKYNADTQEWLFEYELNNSSFTAQQWASINSGITSGDVTLIGTALQPNDNISELINDAGYITSASLPTNYVTTDTAQNISGRKTFLGEKAIYFKQNATTDKLGFTLYNPSNAELGALEWRPNTINGNALLALNCPQSGSNYVGFRYWSNINIIAPRPTTNGNYFIPVNVTDGTNTVTANNNGTLNISSLLPDISDMATQTWVTNQGYTTNVGTVTSVNNVQPVSGNVTITIPTDTSDLTNGAGYITSSALTPYVLSSSLATVATSGSYNDLTNKPTIPTVNNGTLTIQKNGTTVGTFTANQSTNSTINIEADKVLTDDITVSQNSDDELQTIGVIDDNVQNAYNFTVVGSPTITDDGIASGFSSSSFLQVNINLSNKPFIFETPKFVYSQVASDRQYLFTYGSYGTGLFMQTFITSTGALNTSMRNNKTDIFYKSYQLTLNNSYQIKYVLNNTEASIYLKTNDNDYELWYTTTNTSLYTVNNTNMYIGQENYGSTRFYLGSIDLKQFSITVDGAEVYRAWQPPALKYWTGTKAQYDAIATKDANTLYNVEGGGLYKGTTLISNDGADTTLSNVSSIDSNSAVQTALDGKVNLDYSNADYQPVNKAGDTMTGSLIIRKNSPDIHLQNSSFTKGTNPSGTIYWEYKAEDNNTNPAEWYTNRVGTLVTSVNSAGTVDVAMAAYKNDPNSSAAASIRTTITSAGVASCSFPNTTCCDGQWTTLGQNIISSATSLNGSTALTYTVNVPTDGYTYEVLLYGEIETGATSGNYVTAKVYGAYGIVSIGRARTRTASSVMASGSGTIIVDSSRKIYLDRSTSWNGTCAYLNAAAYRRIGSNK